MNNYPLCRTTPLYMALFPTIRNWENHRAIWHNSIFCMGDKKETNKIRWNPHPIIGIMSVKHNSGNGESFKKKTEAKEKSRLNRGNFLPQKFPLSSSVLCFQFHILLAMARYLVWRPWAKTLLVFFFLNSTLTTATAFPTRRTLASISISSYHNIGD